MKKKYQNGFFVFGLLVLIVMITQLDFAQVWQGLCHAGYWFGAVIGLWAFLYIFNTAALVIAPAGEQVAKRDNREPAPKYGTAADTEHHD